MTVHVVESTPDTVRSGYLDPAAKPVATIGPIPPKAVHAVIPKSIFPADLRARIEAWLRPGS